jgi:energy-coupling factor transporter ATP-binding protein EcfA2
MRFVTRQLRVRYPVQQSWAVDRIDLEIAPGMVTWLTGALGSGTSTLLLALGGLAPRLTGGERTGSVTADGEDPAAYSPLQHGIAYLGPAPALQLSGVTRSVRDELAVGPMNLGWTRAASLGAVADAMTRLRLDHLAERAPGSLSGGETQRVLLASLLVISPQAWLLDEPFSALDHASRGHVGQLLVQQARRGANVIVACDDADAMIDVADRLIVMQSGQVVLDGPPRELLSGDAILAARAGSTDAAMLARSAGIAAPRPTSRQELIERVIR